MKARTSRQRQRMKRHCFFRVKRRRDRRRRGERRLERGDMGGRVAEKREEVFLEFEIVLWVLSPVSPSVLAPARCRDPAPGGRAPRQAPPAKCYLSQLRRGVTS